MILNGVIILTLVDFRREFSLEDFWHARKQFVRDMHPDKIYYWNDEDKKAYGEVCKWIGLESFDSIQRASGLKSLSILAGQDISDSDFARMLGIVDYTQDIIEVRNADLKLPGKYMTEEEAIAYSQTKNKKERLHKIEVSDAGGVSVNVFIGGCEVYILPYGECVYVTEIDGYFLRVLPSKIEKGNIKLYLKNIKGEFTSILCVYDYSLVYANFHEISNVSHFKNKHITSDNKYYNL